ncbi:MAG: SOS response-associated peptidase [Candidatus Odinarchaeota archaeon]
MCGRFSMFTYIKELRDRFKIDDILTALEPRYNITPAQKIATVVQRDSRQLVEMKWGLVPSWAKDSKIGNRLINARAETVATKPAFRSAFKKRRCLILADSFFEWQKSGIVKTPMLIRMKSQDTFAMAGLYEYWKMKSGKTLESCAIVTTAANDFMKPIHDRMPVILRPENEDKWLDSELQDVQEITHLLNPIDTDLLEAYEVSTHVNSPRNQDSNVIRPVNHNAKRLS